MAYSSHRKKKKKLQACKPDSVLPHGAKLIIIYLLVASLQQCSCQPTDALSAKLKDPNEQPGIIRLFGISARKVYPLRMLPCATVGSYPTFSPFPTEAGSYFLWHFLSSRCRESQPLAGALLYAVRTFLPNKFSLLAR